MNPEEHLEVLLKKQQVKETLSFLETLMPKERKDLVPHIKKLYKTYDQFVQEGNTYRNRLTEAQRTILSYAAFVCFNQNEFVKSTGSWMIGREYLDKVLPWYCPA